MNYIHPLPRKFSFLIIFLLAMPAASDPKAFPRARCQPPSGSKKLVQPNLENIDLVVYRKADGRVLSDLKKENFAVFLDGVQKEITGFLTPDRPVTVTLLVEYSKLGAVLGDNSSLGLGAVSMSLSQPAGVLLTQLIKLPTDQASVVVFDIRPTSITDFTNDPERIKEAISLLLRNTPAFREAALYDALRFVLLGGRGDPAVLDKSKERQSNYSGLASAQGKRRAIILIGSGFDTSSKGNFTQARKVIQDAGVPIYVIATGGMFRQQSGNRLLSKANEELQKAETQLNAIALETGGTFYPYNAESDGPEALEKIHAMMRGQYSLTFRPGEINDGKAHKIVVKVDVDRDGIYDEQTFVVQARQVYNAAKK